MERAVKRASRVQPLETAPTKGARLLEGDPSSLALDALYRLSDHVPSSESEISEDVDGTRYKRTRIAFKFIDGATVGEVNALLTSMNASILIMKQRVPILYIQIPDPGDLVALLELEQELASNPLVVSTLPATLSENDGPDLRHSVLAPDD